MRISVVCAVAIFAGVLQLSGEQTTTVSIQDPAYGMKAFTVTIPAGWKFDGTVIPGPECNWVPYPVFRAYAADGLSEIRLMPVFNWTFHPKVRNLHAPTGCMDYGRTLTAKEFLERYEELAAANGLHVVGPMPVGAAYEQRVERVGQNMGRMPNIHATADAAAVRVETRNGSFVIEQRLRTYVECRTRTDAMGGGGCSAHVDVVRAPKGKLDALVQLVDKYDLVRTPHEDAWLGRVQQTLNAEAQKRMRQLTEQERASSAMLKKQADDFSAMMQRNHEQFMAQQESQFHSSMNAAMNSMNARSTNTSDWVDYALDRHTVQGPDGYAKVSNQYEHTWSNGKNDWYVTNDPNANPNGSMPGNWVENVKVHGNGQAY